MKWTGGLDNALTVMLASVISTRTIGDQLWVRVMGPASCGKTTLCEAISTAKDYVISVSTIRGFHSGDYNSNEDGDDDPALIHKANGKTLILKDGDTLLTSPNLPQVLAEARDVYDGASRASYRKKGASRNYDALRMSFILCGTASLRLLDQSELGERFLSCIIMEGIDDEFEDDVLLRVAHRAEQSVCMEADGKIENQQTPEMTNVMQLTGGYVQYLRENATALLSMVAMTDQAKHDCTRLGKFVAMMRARPSGRQDEVAEREFAARLVSQHVRLAKCIAAVMNRKTVDEVVMARVSQISMDTANGQTLNIVRLIAEHQKEGMAPEGISAFLGRGGDKVRILLRFLRHIQVLETFHKIKGGVQGKIRWRLTKKMFTLLEEVEALHSGGEENDAA